MIEGLELQHLRVLDALCRSGSITVAAERMNLSQQALSQQLRRLRGITGDRLFVPTGQGVAPTPYVRRIEPRVRRALELLHEIPRPGSLDPARVERTLTVSATDHAQRLVVGPLLRELTASAPAARLAVVDIRGAELTRAMHQGEIDLAFTSDAHVPSGLTSEPLFRERYRCVTGDRTLSLAGSLSARRLAERAFVVVSPGVAGFAGSASDWFERRGLRRHVAVSVPSFFMAQQYLRGSAMVGFLPSRLPPDEGVFEVTLDECPPGYEVVAAYHASAREDAFLAWCLERVRARLVLALPA